jgi:Ycf66 protein N-terminus
MLNWNRLPLWHIAQTFQRHPPPYHPSEEITVFTPAVVIFGMILIMASIGLFFTSKFKPELYQESDNIYAGIGFVCGLILVFSLDLGAAMIFQQMLMIGALVTIMWQFLQVRAENKRLKGGGRSNNKEERSSGRRGGYNARLDDEPEYVPQKRSRPRDTDRSDRQFQPNSYEDGFQAPDRRGSRMLPSGYTREEPMPDVRMPDVRQRDYTSDNNYDRYEERATNSRDYRSSRAENPPQDDWSAPAENRDWEANLRPRRDEKPSSAPRKKPRRIDSLCGI